MNKIILFLILAFTVISCGNMQEDIRIYSDKQVEIGLSLELDNDMSSSLSQIISAFLPNSLSDSLLKSSYKGSITFTNALQNNQNFSWDTLIYFKDCPELHYDTIYSFITEMDSVRRLTDVQQKEFAQKLSNLFRTSYLQLYTQPVLTLSFKTGKTKPEDLVQLGHYLKQMLTDSVITFDGREDFVFLLEKGTFKRGKLSLWQNLFPSIGFVSSGGDHNFMDQFRPLMKTQQHISVIHLPGKVKSVTHPLSRIGQDKKTVTTILTYQDLEQGTTFENTIQYK